MWAFLAALCLSVQVYGFGFGCCGAAHIFPVLEQRNSPHFQNDAHFVYKEFAQVQKFFQDHKSTHPTQIYWSCARLIREKTISINEQAGIGVIVGELMKIVPEEDRLFNGLEVLFHKIYMDIQAHPELSEEKNDELRPHAIAFYTKYSIKFKTSPK